MIVKVLTGHVSAETAYIVDDYPAGFRLRCKKRVWLEHSEGKGFRLCSQTTNPKKSGEVWNAPKKSTYMMLGVMGLDEKGHVTWTACSIYDFSKVEEFGKEYGHSFDKTQQGVHDLSLKMYRLYEAKKATFKSSLAK